MTPGGRLGVLACDQVYESDDDNAYFDKSLD
jgi:hypothetical protein